MTHGTIHVLVLSTADWDAPLWTNKQHLASRLAQTPGVRVTYVESLGLRSVRPTALDAKRVLRRARANALPRETGAVEVVTPRLVPAHTSAAVRRLNRPLLDRTVRAWREDPGTTVLWTYSPLTYGLEELADRTVYHCVDFLGSVDGISADLIDAEEQRLARAGATAVASSAPLADHLVGQGFSDVLTWENVADIAQFTSRDTVGRRPEAVFAGNLTEQKVDPDLLRAVLDAGIHLHLAGPTAIDGAGAPRLAALVGDPRVTYHGLLAPLELAALLRRCTVGLIPYVDSPYTRGVFPMKVYEYLAAGLSVLSTPLPALAATPGIVLGSSREEWRSAALDLRAVDPRTVSANAERAATHSWEARITAVRELLAA